MLSIRCIYCIESNKKGNIVRIKRDFLKILEKKLQKRYNEKCNLLSDLLGKFQKCWTLY